MAIQRKCGKCRRSVPGTRRACPACGSRSASWVARYRGPDHVERSKSFDRRTDAERWLVDEASKVNRGEWVDLRAGLVTLAEWMPRWMAGARPTFEAEDCGGLRLARALPHRARPGRPHARVAPALGRSGMGERDEGRGP